MPVIFNRIMNDEAFKTFIAQKLMHNVFENINRQAEERSGNRTRHRETKSGYRLRLKAAQERREAKIISRTSASTSGLP
jgi:hypothetical protein